MKRGRVDNYRGFVFASLADHGPDLRNFLKGIDSSFDNLIDRSPEGALEHAGGILRYDHDCNWKMFIENLNDTMHPMITHASVGDAAKRYMESQPEGAAYLTEAQIIFPFGSSYEFFDEGGVSVCGSGYTGGKVSIHSVYSYIPGYWDAMVAVDRTIIETHHFRLKGAPEEIFHRSILYSRLINCDAPQTSIIIYL